MGEEKSERKGWMACKEGKQREIDLERGGQHYTLLANTQQIQAGV